jgi:hypothetical protein
VVAHPRRETLTSAFDSKQSWSPLRMSIGSCPCGRCAVRASRRSPWP